MDERWGDVVPRSNEENKRHQIWPAGEELGCQRRDEDGPRNVQMLWWCRKHGQTHRNIRRRHCRYVLSVFITPPTSFSQSLQSIDVTWRHTLSPRCTQRQKSVTGIHWNAYYRLNKGWWRDNFVIMSVSDVLRTHSRLVKCVGGSACSLTPTNFTNLLWARSTSETDLITNSKTWSNS